MKTTITRDEQGDTIYLNINVNNDFLLSSQALPLSFFQSLQTPLLLKPDDYDLIVTRVDIPSRSLPHFVFQALPFPNTDINKGVYSVVIGYQGQYTAPHYLELITETLVPPQIATFSAVQPRQNYLDTYYYVSSYKNLATMITGALRDAITEAATFPTPIPVGVHAYMIYTPNSGLFSILGTQNMFNSNDPFDPLNVQIYLNTPLANMLPSFNLINNGYNLPSGRDELVLITNQLNNDHTTQDGFNPNIPDGYYQIQQEYNSDSSAQSLTRILLESSSMGGVRQQVDVSNAPGGAYKAIILDFVPTAQNIPGSLQSRIQYFVNSEFMRRTLTSSQPFTEIQFAMYWTGHRPERSRPLLLVPGDNASLQLCFEKRRR